MLKVGLTGGIGSGKSTVAGIFEVIGIPVYYADIHAKKLMNNDEELKNEIIKYFGSQSYKEGILNRTYISTIVFADQAKLNLLNSLVHPIIKKEGEAWFNAQTSPYAIHEAALIFEANVNSRLDYVIGVFSPASIRIKRVMIRDKVAEEEILKRINGQMDEDAKMSLCDFVLTNNEQKLLIPQVLDLHEKLLSLSKQKMNG